MPLTSAGSSSLESFSIPSFPPFVMAQLAESNKAVDQSSICEINRTLVSGIMAYNGRPTKTEYDEVARALVMKYHCLRDMNGTGYVRAC
jgi:hypothetical protein